MTEETNPERGPRDWSDDPLESLARELREKVGSEFRAEAETVETETEIGRLRRRAMRDVVREAANRGDRVSVVTAGRTVTGFVAHVGKDYLSLETPTEHLDARLDRVAIVVAPSTSGGIHPRGGSITFKARLSEYEQTGERVELAAPRLNAAVQGRIAVVATDHVIIEDLDGAQNAFPLETVDLVFRSRRTR
jgi:hypothetical protein